jgi:hypothetical protein
VRYRCRGNLDALDLEYRHILSRLGITELPGHRQNVHPWRVPDDRDRALDDLLGQPLARKTEAGFGQRTQHPPGVPEDLLDQDVDVPRCPRASPELNRPRTDEHVVRVMSVQPGTHFRQARREALAA